MSDPIEDQPEPFRVDPEALKRDLLATEMGPGIIEKYEGGHFESMEAWIGDIVTVRIAADSTVNLTLRTVASTGDARQTHRDRLFAATALNAVVSQEEQHLKAWARRQERAELERRRNEPMAESVTLDEPFADEVAANVGWIAREKKRQR